MRQLQLCYVNATSVRKDVMNLTFPFPVDTLLLFLSNSYELY